MHAMIANPIPMEKYFNPGFKVKAMVIIGSQTLPFFHGDPKQQAWEGFLMAAAHTRNLAIVRHIEEDYIDYWRSLMGNPTIVNLKNTDQGEFLTRVVLNDKNTLNVIKKQMPMNAKLSVFLPTMYEQELADKLGIPLHASPDIYKAYGTKSGIRMLADEAKIQMTPGFVCAYIDEVKEALTKLEQQYEYVIIKHDMSISGEFSQKLKAKEIKRLKKHLDHIAGGKFIEGKDVVVVEGWLRHKTALCAHIEILESKEPIICAGWQQVMGDDGITYIGAGPLMISDKALRLFIEQSKKLARVLKEKGAIGSFAPDFLVVDRGEKKFAEDDVLLLELNARVPYTAFPLEIVKQIKGKIGTGFYSHHINLSKTIPFSEIKKILEQEGLLITKKDDRAKGVVPYNVGLLPYKLFDVVAMADTWEETKKIMEKVDALFQTPKPQS